MNNNNFHISSKRKGRRRVNNFLSIHQILKLNIVFKYQNKIFTFFFIIYIGKRFVNDIFLKCRVFFMYFIFSNILKIH